MKKKKDIGNLFDRVCSLVTLMPCYISGYFDLFLLIAEISEEEAEDRLQDAIQEKFAVFGDVCIMCLI